ncbi:MAG: SpoIIE family protein phosphatase [Spirochaetales bacterium]|nr:SpoIIE family protein phosphatase [Spirochaetales bacterium]
MGFKDIAGNFVKNAPVGLVIIDNHNEVIFTNSFLQKRTGYEEKELKGKGFFNRLFPDEQIREIVIGKIAACMKRPFEDFQVSIQKKSGNKISASLSCSAFKQGIRTMSACVIHDMTRRDIYEKVIEAGYDDLQQATIDLETANKKITEQQEILKAYKDRMTRELEIATSIQHAIIPKEFPLNEKIEIWGTSIPSEKLGGDYFDIFYLDTNVYGILIADVAGHGVAASLLTTMLKAYFEYYTKHHRDPAHVFSRVNQSLSSILGDSGFFLTALYCVLDFNTMTITSCTAGHESAICFHPEHKEPVRIGAEAKALVLGVFPEAVYTSVSFQLIPGCKIFFYTDGITEARGETGEYFGYKRLVDYLDNYFKNNPGKGAKECIIDLFSEIDSFYGKNTPNDDRTAVFIRIHQ